MPEKAMTILFIDDDEDLVAALAAALEHNGYRVRHASDGDQGVAMAMAETPDLILLDWMMPVKNGFEACSEIRRSPALRDVPIVALTAFGQNIGEVHGLTQAKGPQIPLHRDFGTQAWRHPRIPIHGGLGGRHIQDCLEKPVEINVLLQRVAAALNGERLEE